MIQIETKAYGPMEIHADQILTFKDGIFAFEDFKKFAIVCKEKDSLFYWLQSLEQVDLAFLVCNPNEIYGDYQPEILNEQLLSLGSDQLSDLDVYCILTVPSNQPEMMTINLQGPIIINSKQSIGAQLISSNEKHEVKSRVFDNLTSNESSDVSIS